MDWSLYDNDLRQESVKMVLATVINYTLTHFNVIGFFFYIP